MILLDDYKRRQVVYRIGFNPIRIGLNPLRMARKNTVKKFMENSFYHLYNRGVDRREIFSESQDYHTFLWLLKFYLSPFVPQARPGFKEDKPSLVSHKQHMNLHGQMTLLAYCLMPNHFHLLVKQREAVGITQLMRRICVNYSMYFNRKYERKGSLFESIYKAVLIESESQLLHLSRYIHLNPLNLKVSRFGPVTTTTTARPGEYEYSSYSKYLDRQALSWFDSQPILGMFGQGDNRHTSYQGFVEDYRVDSHSVLGPLVLEEEKEKR